MSEYIFASEMIVPELEAKIKELEAKLERLTLRAAAVVDYNPYCNDKKPSSTDCYGVNGVLLWQLRKELEKE